MSGPGRNVTGRKPTRQPVEHHRADARRRGADRTQTLCSFVLVPTCLNRTNVDAVAAALARGVVVQTWGSSQDGVIYPPACGTPGFWVDATSTQVVTGAGGGMHAEGDTSNCLLSHIAVIGNRAGEIADSIGPQQ